MGQLLAADLPEPDYGRPAVSTGLSDLDELTGGLLPGSVWVLVGAPGSGRTMLACQLARVSAGEERTRLVTPLVGPREVRAMVLAGTARVPLHHLRSSRLTEDDEVRLAMARATLTDSSLTVEAVTRHADVPDPDTLLNACPARALIIDDFDVWAGDDAGPVLRRLRAYALDSASSVVVTLPEDSVLDGRGHLRRDWARIPRVVVRLSRIDLQENAVRAGEVDLTVMGTGARPSATVSAGFQGHYARFADLA